jgi:hypothetical protein
MPHDSHGGYLSGILQRGARNLSPRTPANPERPAVPGPAPFFDALSGELHSEIETLQEPADSQNPSGGEPAGELLERPSQFLSRESEWQQPADPAPDPPDSRQASASNERAVFSSAQPARRAASTLAPIGADVEPAERSQWGERLPRLVRSNVDEEPGNSINQAVRDTRRGGDQQAVAEATSRVESAATPSTQLAASVSAASLRKAKPAEVVSSLDEQPSKRKPMESRDAAGATALVQSYQGSQVVLLQALRPAQDSSTPDVVPVVNRERNQLAPLVASGVEPIEQGREVVVENTATLQRERPVIRSSSPSPRDEFPGRASRQQSPASPQPNSPKLTINRLDVQIVNQSMPSVAQLPPAPAAQLDGCDNLERYHLGHPDLIF